MARATVTIYTDDLTGKTGDNISAHSFSVDGVSYDIDLAPESYQRLLDTLAPFVQAARRQGAPKGRRTPQRGDTSKAARIREWARKQGIEVNTRGLVRQDIVERYEAEAATADR
ncbi:Lsr2 family protein [Streptomyces hygroscopicus subsp. hygroscopicus]|uniref:histone-like nucleoid-structuring protein Lsr2 n=1 Tax=Streptomyces sp. KHY 26 TaxID=3097359 RepID=UPI0024A53BAE|nr:Lsr2 family protein [Streptomyces hygroscopicus]GLX49179.1 Lsr2 family protein [Streptomyces hygroscopicus subsp. hygroscopicus]